MAPSCFTSANSLINFIINENSLYGVSIGDDINAIEHLLPHADKVDSDDCGWYTVDEIIKFFYFDRIVSEISIGFFEKHDVVIPIDIEICPDISKISGETRIHEFIRILNCFNIPWIVHRSDTEYAYLRLKNRNLYIIFDLDEGYINRISLSAS